MIKLTLRVSFFNIFISFSYYFIGDKDEKVY